MWLQPQALSLSTLYGRSDQLNPPTSHRDSEHIASDPQHFQLTLAGHFASDPLSIHKQHVISQKQQTPMVCDTVAASQLRLQKLYYEQQQKKQGQRKLNWLLGQQHQIKSQNESRTMQLSNLPPTDQQQQHIHSDQQQQKFGDSTTLLAVYDSGLRASTGPLETNAAGQAKVACIHGWLTMRSILQRVAVCVSVLQYVAVCCATHYCRHAVAYNAKCVAVRRRVL